MNISEKIIRAKADCDAVYKAGKQAEYDAFWDVFQENGKRKNYNYGFSYEYWNDDIFKPKYPFDDITTASNMFYATGITTIPRLCINTANINALFGNSSNIRWVESLVFLQEITSATNTFLRATSLEHCPIESGVIGATVNSSDCPFDKVTITSFVNALSSTATRLTFTLNKAAVNKAFETSEGAADGNTSAEWSNLIATKQNWTIELV